MEYRGCEIEVFSHSFMTIVKLPNGKRKFCYASGSREDMLKVGQKEADFCLNEIQLQEVERREIKLKILADYLND